MSPAWLSSNRINIETTKPSTPEKAPNKKYKVPIVLWFVEKIQRVIQAFSNKNIKDLQKKVLKQARKI